MPEGELFEALAILAGLGWSEIEGGLRGAHALNPGGGRAPESPAVGECAPPAGAGGVLPVPLTQGKLQAVGHYTQVPLQVSGACHYQGLKPVSR